MEEKAQQIIEYLSALGFEIPGLYSAYQKAGSQFKLDNYKSFGNDSMKYNIDFSWDHQFENFRLEGYKATYIDKNGQERSKRFSASYAGIAHADLAYNVLSGRLEDIRQKLWATEIEEFTGDDVNAFLENILCETPETFNFYSFNNSKEGFIEFEVKVILKDSFYEPSDIIATFTRYPDIAHGIFNGVDTEELEARMAAIDWNRNGLYELDDDDVPQTTPEIEEIFDAITLLLRDEKGKETALNLQIRNWHEVPFFEAHVHDEAWKLYEGLPKSTFTFPIETGAHKIYNLMCGRPAIAPKLKHVEHDTNGWLLLKTMGAGLELTKVEGPSRYEIETFLTMLPVDDMDKEEILTRLLRGDTCTTTLYGLEPTRVNISVDLPAKALKIATLDGRVIPYNFRLDPEKQQLPPPAIHPGKWEQRHSKKNKKRKGRGI